MAKAAWSAMRTAVIIYVTAVLTAAGLYLVSQRPERAATDVNGLANCVAEMSYQHQMPDKFAELENALRLCTKGR